MDKRVRRDRTEAPAEAEEYVDGGYIDLDSEHISDAVTGKRITEADAERLADEAERKGPPGRPSLSGSGSGVSPQVAFRVPASTKRKLKAVSAAEGRRETDIARTALEEYLERRQF